MSTPLLQFDHVTKSSSGGARTQVVTVDDASWSMYPGDFVGVWAERPRERACLLRLAAGLIHPDSGYVRFLGHDLARPRGNPGLGSGIGYAQMVFLRGQGTTVLQTLSYGPLIRGATPSNAKSLVLHALRRTEAQNLSELRMQDLNPDEIVRVAIARALITLPQMLVVDDPTQGLDFMARDAIFALLRSLADQGLGVLTAGKLHQTLDRTLSLSDSDGRLRGALDPRLATVTALPQAGRQAKRA